jgi:cobalt-zinc-cadmium efflux system outer membrane protein
VAYQEGEIGILQLLDAYRTQRQAQLRMLEIQAAVKEAQIELERVVGEELGK